MKLKVNTSYKITREINDFRLARRMAELGFTIGSIIELKQISLMKKNYLFVCRNVSVSLSKSIVFQLGLINE